LTITIITGGQTGVDRAALDFSLDHGIPCGGFCPKGRLAEDGTIPDKYPLIETKTAEYADRTEQNILDSDGTLIIYSGSMAGGTLYTCHFAKTKGAPLFLIDVNKAIPVKRFHSWQKRHAIHKLNIAGPRESQQAGIYQKTIILLTKLGLHRNVYV